MKRVPFLLSLSCGPHLSFSSRRGPISAVQVNSHGAKIEPATVKWPRPCHGPNAAAVLNAGCDLLAVGKWAGAADFSHWESNENHWAYYGLCCYQWFYTAARQGFGVFSFLPLSPHGSVIALSGGLIRHFGGLYPFVNTSHRGKFCLITPW